MYTTINMLKRQTGGAESAKVIFSLCAVRLHLASSVCRSSFLYHSVCLTAVRDSRLFCRFCCSSLNRWSRSSASNRICYIREKVTITSARSEAQSITRHKEACCYAFNTEHVSAGCSHRCLFMRFVVCRLTVVTLFSCSFSVRSR